MKRLQFFSILSVLGILVFSLSLTFNQGFADIEIGAKPLADSFILLENVEKEASVQASVSIEPALQSNPLARKIVVKTDKSCCLSGRITAQGIAGYGPSNPVESTEGTLHEFWFYGLVESTEFAYKFYRADADGAVIAEGTFSTDALPEGKPTVESLEYVSDSGTDWYMIYQAYLGHLRVFLYDRVGRIRFYHDSDIGQFNQVLENGHIVGTKHSELRALKPDGTEYTLFDVALDDPVYRNSHHKFYVPSSDSDWAMVVFARKGWGLKCDLVTPTDQTVGDGIARIDAKGNELWRFDVFDHLDEVPLTAIDPDMCLEEFWGTGTIDFTHGNAVIPAPIDDTWLLSYRNVSRILKIDDQTGQIVWQLGHDLDFEWIGDESEDEQFFKLQHDPQYLQNGNLIIYDNNKDQDWSRVIELKVDEEAMTAKKVWEYRTPHHKCEGNTQENENGNLLISTGNSANPMTVELPLHGQEGDEVFKMVFNGGIVRAEYYPAIWQNEDGSSDDDDIDDDQSEDDDEIIDDDSSGQSCGCS